MRLARAIRYAFHEPDAPSYKAVHSVLWVAIAASVLLVLVELFTGWHQPWMEAVDRWLLGLFWVELVLRVGSFQPKEVGFYRYERGRTLRAHVLGRLRYSFTPLILIDIITVLGSFSWLRGLRVLRLLRLLHGTRLFKYSSPLQGSLRAFGESRLLFAAVFTLIGGAVLLGGLSFFAFEQGRGQVHGISDALWWALVTITTVGYGDISPTSGGGRIVAAGLMVSGMGMLALMAGIVGQTLMGAVLTLREEAFRMGDYTGHVVICGYDAAARMLLDSVAREFPDPRVDLVVFAPGPRPEDVPPRYAWVSGEPAKESELAKVRMERARAAIIVGARGMSPQASDANTILTLFTIRSYMATLDSSADRTEPLYLVAEILDEENVVHAETAGADEVIETTLLGFSLLAHAVKEPGTARLMGQVASPDFQSLYVGAGPTEPIVFGDLARDLRARFGVLIIGVRQDGEDLVNPPVGTIVPAGAEVLYLARLPVDLR